MLQRTAAIAGVFTLLRLQKSHKLAACKTLASGPLALSPSLFSYLSQASSAQQILLAAVVGAAAPNQRSPSRPTVLPVQQVTHCTRERIEANVLLRPCKLLQLASQLSSNRVKTGSSLSATSPRSGFETVCTLAEARRAAHRCANKSESAKPPRERQDRCRRKRRNAAPARTS